VAQSSPCFGLDWGSFPAAMLDTPATIKVSKALPEETPVTYGRFAFQTAPLKKCMQPKQNE
jgi:hypothetical protein